MENIPIHKTKDSEEDTSVSVKVQPTIKHVSKKSAQHDAPTAATNISEVSDKKIRKQSKRHQKPKLTTAASGNTANKITGEAVSVSPLMDNQPTTINSASLTSNDVQSLGASKASRKKRSSRKGAKKNKQDVVDNQKQTQTLPEGNDKSDAKSHPVIPTQTAKKTDKIIRKKGQTGNKKDDREAVGVDSVRRIPATENQRKVGGRQRQHKNKGFIGSESSSVIGEDQSKCTAAYPSATKMKMKKQEVVSNQRGITESNTESLATIDGQPGCIMETLTAAENIQQKNIDVSIDTKAKITTMATEDHDGNTVVEQHQIQVEHRRTREDIKTVTHKNDKDRITKSFYSAAKTEYQNELGGAATSGTRQVNIKSPLPSFDQCHQRRDVKSLPTEEIQFEDFSQNQQQLQTTRLATSQLPTNFHGQSIPPRQEHIHTLSTLKPVACTSTTMPRRDRKKKLSMNPVLDPSLSLQNYFVPASNDDFKPLKFKETTDHRAKKAHAMKDSRLEQSQSQERKMVDGVQKKKGDESIKTQKPKKERRKKQKETVGEEGNREENKELRPKTPKETPEYIHQDDKVTAGRRPRYERYMAPALIAEGIEKGSLYQGLLRINRRNRSDGYVTSDNLEHDIYIHGLRDRNRALEGDMVAIRLLDVDKVWESKKLKDNLRKKGKSNDNEDPKKISNVATEVETDGDDDEVEEEEIDKHKPKYCGQVIGIVHRMEGQKITGTLFLDNHQGKCNDITSIGKEDDENRMTSVNNNNVKLIWFTPTDKRAPLIAIPATQAPIDFLTEPSKYKNEIFVAKTVRWPIDSRYPFGKLMTDLGPVGEMAVEAQSILANNSILDIDFSAKALRCLPKTPWTIPEKEYKVRRDLRFTRIFTIDPETAKDLDDALHITRLEDNKFEVGVHIADVSYFLKQSTQLDIEAKDRATSTYLVDRVIPMLPSLLCEQLCSLNPGVERLAFSVIWKMDDTGNILDTWFGRTIIQSCAKLAYDDAQNVIEDKGLPTTAKVVNHSVTAVEQDILDLLKLSKSMRKRRYENGALSMNSIKLAFKLDDDGEPVKVWVYQLKEANRLIEEFMLRANMSVAEKICEHYPEEAMLRRHEPPIERRLDEFIKIAEDLGYHIDGSTSGTLQASFDAIESEDVKYVLRILAIKPMRRAKYFCTGSFDDDAKYLHFALNVPMYTHFTSPIRRYADVIVHRQLECILQDKDACGYSKKKVQSIALQCNRKKDGAKTAQEQSGHLYLARYLSCISQVDGPIVRNAIVLQVTADAFDLLVPDYGLESRVYMDAMPLERFVYNADDISLTVYWKQDGVMNVDTIDNIRESNRQACKSKDNSSDTNYTNVGDETLASIDERKERASKPAEETSKMYNSMNQCQIDTSNRMQKFQTFARFEVLIQVNAERTPPIINIYPVNPFVRKA